MDKNTKKSLTRVIVTRADIDMKEIKAQYHNLYGVSLPQKVEEVARGNYKDFLLNLIVRGGWLKKLKTEENLGRWNWF